MLLGPLLVNLIGVDGLFATVGVALVVSAALLWPLPSTRNRLDEGVLGFRALWGEILFVLRYVRTDRLIAWGVAQWTIGSTLALIIATLAPTFVVVVLRVRAEDAVFVLAPAGIGTVVGSLLLIALGGPRRPPPAGRGRADGAGHLHGADGARGDALAAAGLDRRSGQHGRRHAGLAIADRRRSWGWRCWPASRSWR